MKAQSAFSEPCDSSAETEKHIAILPIRAGTSEELAMASINDVTILQYTLNQIASAKLISKVIIVTSSQSIIQYIKSLNQDLFVACMRPAYLEDLNSPLEPTVDFVLQDIDDEIDTSAGGADDPVDPSDCAGPGLSCGRKQRGAVRARHRPPAD